MRNISETISGHLLNYLVLNLINKIFVCKRQKPYEKVRSNNDNGVFAVIGLALYTIDLFYFSDNKIGMGSTKEIDVDNLNNAETVVGSNSQKNDRQIKIEYDLPKSSFVVIKIFNTEGKEMMSLVNKREHSGYHFVSMSANGLPEGIYSYRIQAGIL